MVSSPYSFIISKSTSNIFQAENTSTGSIQFSNSSASSVFNSVINAMNNSGGGGGGGGKAFVRNALYPINAAIMTKNFTGLVGESREKTILRSTVSSGDNEVFRYWAGASSSAPLEGFSLSNLKIEFHNKNGNGSGESETAWVSSGTRDCTFDNIWVKSFSKPSVSWIGFFLDTANRTNFNENCIVRNSRFEGPCAGQDMLGCGNLVSCDFSNNQFVNCDGQAIGVGASYRSIISNNRFVNTGNAIGYEDLCENNLIHNNLCHETDGIKLSEQKSTGVNISRNNTCTNNLIMYGWGGIEAGISIDDVISNNKLYRTERNGIYGSFLRTVIENNQFVDTNYSWTEQPLLGNTTNNHRIGGIFCYNTKAPVTIQPKNELNVFTNNTFIKSGVAFAAPDNPTNNTRTGNPGGIVIDTKYTNSFINLNKGNIGNDLLKNFGTTATP